MKMKIKIFFILLFVSSICFSTNKYFVGGGTGNYNSTTNWSLTSGGGSGAAVPSSSDSVFLNAASGANTLTVNVSSSALTFICTGFTGTLAGSATLTVSGSVTLVSGMNITHTGILGINETGTLTSNGKTWPGSITFSGASKTYTLADDWTVTGTVNSSVTGTAIFNGNTINCNTHFTIGASGITGAGSTTFAMRGTGTVTTSTGALTNNFVINSSGTVTFATVAAFTFATGTFTYTAGTVVTTGHTLTLSGSCTLNTNGITWNNITFSATATITINSSLTCTGTATMSSSSVNFQGTAGWTFATLSITTGDSSLKFGRTYTITTSFTVVGLTGNHGSIVSDTPGSQVVLTLTNGIVLDCLFFDVTDVTGSLGATGWSNKGTLSNATNWRVLPTQPQTVSY